jgi:oxalate decarboxylase
VPRGYGHYIENTGTEPLRVLVVLNSGVYGDISISDWLARNPARLVAEHFNLPLDVVERFPKRKVIIA